MSPRLAALAAMLALTACTPAQRIACTAGTAPPEPSPTTEPDPPGSEWPAHLFEPRECWPGSTPEECPGPHNEP